MCKRIFSSPRNKKAGPPMWIWKNSCAAREKRCSPPAKTNGWNRPFAYFLADPLKESSTVSVSCPVSLVSYIPLSRSFDAGERSMPHKARKSRIFENVLIGLTLHKQGPSQNGKILRRARSLNAFWRKNRPSAAYVGRGPET